MVVIYFFKQKGLHVKRLILILILIATLIPLAGCTKKLETDKKVAVKTDAYPMTLTDSKGREVEIAAKPKRIVSLSPSNTEIIFALGAGDRLVGVTEYCNYPKEAKDIDKVGGFSDPNIERIVSLKPDIAFVAGSFQDETITKLESLGITVFLVDAKSLTGVLENIETVGTILGEMEMTVEVTGKMRAKINDIESALKKASGTPLVFFEIYKEPLMSAGPGTFIDDLIIRSKGKNAAGATKEEYPQFSTEKLIELDPDVYIAVTGSNSEPGNIKERPGWDTLKAVQNNRISIVNDDLVSRPGPRIVNGYELIAKAVHPEVFD